MSVASFNQLQQPLVPAATCQKVAACKERDVFMEKLLLLAKCCKKIQIKDIWEVYSYVSDVCRKFLTYAATT